MATLPLPRSTPEDQGISSAALLKFVKQADTNIHEMHSFMLLRHGCVVAEGWWKPYAPDRPHMLFSLTKSFTSSAVGFAVAEGRLSVNDPVISFFPGDLPAVVSPNLAAMKVRHLLTMTSGHDPDTTDAMFSAPDRNLVKAFLALPVDYEPGTHFVYNSGASHMLSEIIMRVTGETLLDYLMPRLFRPLGIPRPKWELSPDRLNTGGWGLYLRTEDIARFGQMLLQKGAWNGQRLLDEGWIQQATRKQVPNGDDPNSDWNQGYGFQFWMCRNNAFRGDGAFGQYCVVMPRLDAVLAITSGVPDMQHVLNVVWDQLLPAFKDAQLPADPADQQELKRALDSLALFPPHGAKHSPVMDGPAPLDYTFAPNPLGGKTASLRFSENRLHFELQMGRNRSSVECGLGEWVEGESALFTQGRGRLKSTSSAVWTAPDTLSITVRYYETPFYYTVICQFKDNSVEIHAAPNVAFGPTELPVMVGVRNE